MFAFTVDLGVSIQEDNVAFFPETMETRRLPGPTARVLGRRPNPRHQLLNLAFFALSRPVPGAAGEPSTDSSSRSVRLDVSSDKAQETKTRVSPWPFRVAAAPRAWPTDKTPGRPRPGGGLPATPGPEHPRSESRRAAAPPSPRTPASLTNSSSWTGAGTEPPWTSHRG